MITHVVQLSGHEEGSSGNQPTVLEGGSGITECPCWKCALQLVVSWCSCGSVCRTRW